MFVASLLSFSEEVLLSPRLLDKAIGDISYFGSFRAKEIWIDLAVVVVNNALPLQLSTDECARINDELLSAGTLGPGPRRLLRFFGGTCIRKVEFTVREAERFRDIETHMLEHFQERFSITGYIQKLFTFCEISKAVSFSRSGKKKELSIASGLCHVQVHNVHQEDETAMGHFCELFDKCASSRSFQQKLGVLRMSFAIWKGRAPTVTQYFERQKDPTLTATRQVYKFIEEHDGPCGDRKTSDTRHRNQVGRGQNAEHMAP